MSRIIIKDYCNVLYYFNKHVWLCPADDQTNNNILYTQLHVDIAEECDEDIATLSLRHKKEMNSRIADDTWHIIIIIIIITYIYYALLSSVMFSNTRMNLKREAVYD